MLYTNQVITIDDMAQDGIAESVVSALEANGFKGKVVPVQHLYDLKREIQGLYDEGILDTTFYRNNLGFLRFEIPDACTDISSIIITSAVQPQKSVGFIFKGRQYHFTVPPTYSYDTDQTVEKVISEVIKPRGFHLWPVKLPLKLLAVHSGLAKYGRNNITYVEGCGSFHRLRAYFSDIPEGENSWCGPEMLEQCHTCRACLQKCPTGAIVPHHFIIQAERCLTLHNEASDDFPGWIEPAWHNSLIGCMTCQLVCPANKASRNWIEDGGQFNQEETRLILSGARHELTEATVGKLRKLGLLEDFDLLPRNLRVLLN